MWLTVTTFDGSHLETTAAAAAVTIKQLSFCIQPLSHVTLNSCHDSVPRRHSGAVTMVSDRWGN